MERPKISREIFVQLRDFIYEKSGMFFQENKTYLLEDRLSRRLEARNLSNYEEYLYFLRYDLKKDDELKELFNAVTTNETSFFRDINQLDAFRFGIIPKIMEKKANSGQKSVRIWSAGCSTGEEPYTLAMMAMEEGLTLKGWGVEITASDISEQVLTSARRAAYGEYAVRNTNEAIIKKYFLNSSSGYVVKPEVKQMVRLTNLNLLDVVQMRGVRGMDVIFCRNVLIYFDDNAKRKVIGHFYDSLVDGGFLVVGFSESLFNLTRAFKPVGINKCVTYQKI
ncbi:MAG: protein-glutamate O-methyltransferase CheR [Deltaproteobacteria bacterium]|nr:protein-glutamate O-methyltransferase CheR [Deltaproteobacteria bacterium]